MTRDQSLGSDYGLVDPKERMKNTSIKFYLPAIGRIHQLLVYSTYMKPYKYYKLQTH